MLTCNIVNEENPATEQLKTALHTFMPKYIVYHNNCPDGVASAWIVWSFYKNEPIMIGTYPGNLPEEVAEDEAASVLYVDLSPDKTKYPDIVSRNIIIIDHHKSCYNQYADFPRLIYGGMENKWSAAMMCQHIFETNYKWVEYVSDRDTWQFKLDYSDAINMAIYIKEYLTVPDLVDDYLDYLQDLESLRRDGLCYLEVRNKYVQDIAKHVYIHENGDKKIGLVNCPILQSDVGNYLVNEDENEIDTAVMYTVNNILYKNFIKCSARSRDKSALPLAELFGGGGHANAAGFSTTMSYMRKKLNPSKTSGYIKTFIWKDSFNLAICSCIGAYFVFRWLDSFY